MDIHLYFRLPQCLPITLWIFSCILTAPMFAHMDIHLYLRLPQCLPIWIFTCILTAPMFAHMDIHLYFDCHMHIRLHFDCSNVCPYGYSFVFSPQQSYLGCNYGMCSEYFHFVWFDVHFQGVIFLELNKIKTALTEALGQLFLALGQL